jgi:hypothetical protein
VDRYCVGCTLLDPAMGWALVRKLAEPANDFMVRYAALKAVRFLHTNRPGVVTKNDLVAVVGTFLDQDDIADLAVDQLRTWRCWDQTERVLALAEKKTAPPVVRRAVLRYAIRCPDKRCKAHVAKERAKDPEFVKDTEESLRLEDGRDPTLN